MKCAALIAALLVAGCTGTMPDIRPLPMAQTVQTSPFDNAYQAGKTYLVTDRVGLAVVMFQKALAYDPLSVAALNAIGAAYDQLHRPEVAKTYYLQALAIEPNGADTLNNMAVSAALAGDEMAAHDLFAQAAKIDPANATIRDNLQVARMTPPEAPPTSLAESDFDPSRPYLERTGLAEVTLTIPGVVVQTLPPPAAVRQTRQAETGKPGDWYDFDAITRGSSHAA
jgi:tetratricopeptide (TPR) repeat protein